VKIMPRQIIDRQPKIGVSNRDVFIKSSLLS
jgi:hypothetical protein